MKQNKTGLLYHLCSFCIALGIWISNSCPSMVFFGEPDYPANK